MGRYRFKFWFDERPPKRSLELDMIRRAANRPLRPARRSTLAITKPAPAPSVPERAPPEFIPVMELCSDGTEREAVVNLAEVRTAHADADGYTVVVWRTATPPMTIKLPYRAFRDTLGWG